MARRANTGEDVIDAVHAAVKRALLMERVRDAVKVARADVSSDIPDDLFEPVAKLVKARHYEKINDVAIDTDDVLLEDTAERFVALARRLRISELTFEQLLEAYSTQDELLTRDDRVDELLDSLATRIVTHVRQLFGDQEEAANLTYLRTSFEHLQSAVADLSRHMDVRLAAIEMDRGLLNAIEDIFGPSAETATLRSLPVRVFVDGGIMADARVNRAVRRVMESSDFEALCE